ncbi:MAG: DsbA family protein [Gemmatimonadota bacterium]|nr:DsbA family protein [Gemmatimonadota bacterium]MDH3423623.1 DsbA family protein [Gemmatimonadota bacterium]
MRSNVRVVALLTTVLAIGACAGEEGAAEGADTAALTRDLLQTPAGDGQSTPLAVDPSLVQGGPPVAVSAVGFNRGLETAPVKVVELSDYGCGYCRQFHQETFPTLLAQFIDSGMVEWKFVPFVTGMFDNSVAATEAAECVYVQDEDAFETLNGRLWDEQAEWKRSNDPESVIDGWVGELAGVDRDEFRRCVQDDTQLGRVAAATTLAQQLGVRGTPTFVVIGYPPLQGALPLEMFQEVLTLVHEQAVGGAQ